MKKHLLLILSLLLVFSITSNADSINITVDNQTVQFNDDLGYPYIDSNNRTLVPFRIILEKFGATVGWESETKTGIATKDGIEVKVPIGQSYILKDNEQITNDTMAVIKDGRTYLPIRVVIEALGGRVEWVSDTKTVALYTSGDVTEVPVIDDGGLCGTSYNPNGIINGITFDDSMFSDNNTINMLLPDNTVTMGDSGYVKMKENPAVTFAVLPEKDSNAEIFFTVQAMTSRTDAVSTEIVGMAIESKYGSEAAEWVSEWTEKALKGPIGYHKKTFNGTEIRLGTFPGGGITIMVQK